MTRTRLAAAALSAAVVGLTLSLAPAVSMAAPDTGVRPATPTVEWADSGADFATIDQTDGEGIIVPQGWSWAAFGSAEGTALEDVVDFTAEGVANNGTSPQVVLLHGLDESLAPEALPALVEDAAVEIGEGTSFGLLIAPVDDPDGTTVPVVAIGGVNGSATLWEGPEGEPVDTATLVQEMEGRGYDVVGYVLVLGDRPLPVEPGEPEVPVDPQDPPVLLLSELGEVSALADDAASSSAAVAVAAAPAEGAASVRFADLTTYFTPQPSAVLTLGTTSVTTAQATSVGIPFSASGFAPGETATVGLSAGQSGNEVPGVSFVADAAGAVSGTVVLPADLATVGSFSLVLIGSSSGQAAFAAFEITSGAAPVAVPVPAPATFAG